IQWDYQDTTAVNLNLGTGAGQVNVLGTGVTTTIVNTAPATINVGSAGSIAGIQGLLILENTSGPNNTVNVNSQNDSRPATAFVGDQGAGSRPPLGFLNVPGLPNQVFWITAAPSVVNLNRGAGTSPVNVLATSVPTNVLNNGTATVNVGDVQSNVG